MVNNKERGVGIVKYSPKNNEISSCILFEFDVTNNKVEYKVIRDLEVWIDSQLVVNYIFAKKKHKEMIKNFESIKFMLITQSENYKTDALAWFAMTQIARVLRTIHIQLFITKSIDKKEQTFSRFNKFPPRWI